MTHKQTLSYTSFDNDTFDYLKWSTSQELETVIIAIHGINGAADDYDNLASHLLNSHTKIGIFAPETRGQGNDRTITRRGDIYHKEEWFKDLDIFTKHIQSQHPNAELIWCGESMGSLIVTHAFTELSEGNAKPDRMILLAPVVSLRPHLSLWKHYLANLIAYLFPRIRVPLNKFSGEQAVKVTQVGDSHDEQAATNSYFIDKFTLRLLATLGNLISDMNHTAKNINIPFLLLNGGKDYFTPAENAEKFYSHISSNNKNKHCFYENSYHLLMYDEHREEIFADISKWIQKP